MAFFGNLGVKLRGCLCEVPRYASTQLKSCKFSFVVRIGVLESEDAETFYANSIPVAYEVPVRRYIYYSEAVK